MKKQKYYLILIITTISLCQAQNDLIYSDYLTFGSKEPASLGSMFSALSNEPIFLNPANVAFVTDNRIMAGGSFSDLGNSYMLSWTAPNISISNARHSADLQDSLYYKYRKDLLKFSFGISNTDLGLKTGNTVISAGLAVKRLSDRLFATDSTEFGGNALIVDLGFQLTWNVLTFELAMLNLNAPRIGETNLSYAQATCVTLRYKSNSGFKIAIQGISSRTYAGSDVGINIAAQQSFFDHRLTSRIQLTSFFSGTEAIMQNISGSIGYRPMLPEKYVIFQDIEFSYALSFLSMPQTVGTHFLLVTKYF
jgi:hypothetical protein